MEGVVESVHTTGIAVKVMGLYNATIDVAHIPASVDIEKTYSIGSKVIFRILYCQLNVDQKKIGGSLLSHVVDLGKPMVAGKEKKDTYVGDLFPSGSFIEKAIVTRVNSLGVYVSVDDLEGVTGFVHVSQGVVFIFISN